MKLRIKFCKIGNMKFISHLDLMRYVQKALRRANIDVAYSQGYNPHQILSFASPLGLGDTSEGDYLDLQVNSIGDFDEFLHHVNEQMNDEIRFLSVKRQDDQSKPSMALVAAADYCVHLREGYEVSMKSFPIFMEQKEILVSKKTKRNTTEVDIRPMIDIWAMDMEDFCRKQRKAKEPICPKQSVWEEGLKAICYLRLSCGSSNHLKPNLVMETFCKWAGIEYVPFAFQIHRLETYMDISESMDQKQLISLGN